MNITTDQLVQQIHDTPLKMVVSISGGGARAVSDLLEVPGASRTLLAAAVPYCEASLTQWLGGRPDEFCSLRTARAMAMAAFLRARKLNQPDENLAGLGCTSALATDRPKKGAHRIHIAAQTDSFTATWSIELQKNRRSRSEEEHLAGRMVLNAAASICGVTARLPLELLEGENISETHTKATPAWQDLLLGKIEMVCNPPGSPAQMAIFPGTFNPIHEGHRKMIAIAKEILKRPVALEMSILNVEKPPLDFYEMDRRTKQFGDDQPVILTRAATFEEKSTLFPGATFVVGTDTLRRIAQPVFYADSRDACLAALQRIANRGCKFLVFGRDMGTGFVRQSDLELPDILKNLCREITPDIFREDISSTSLRKSGAW